MGTISKGLLGPVSGTVGPVVAGTWKGISYLRSKPTVPRNGSTEKQKQQQAKFILIMRLLQPMKALLAISFQDYAIGMTGFNNAMRYNMMNAITGTYPALSIDYSLVLVSRGDLPNAVSPTATTSGGSVVFTWTDNSGTGSALPTDASILVAYCPARKQCIYTVAGANRGAGTAALELTAFVGLEVHTYIGFIAADGKGVASSVYTGMVVVE